MVPGAYGRRISFSSGQKRGSPKGSGQFLGMCQGWCKPQSRAAKEPEPAEWNISKPEVQECGQWEGLRIKLAF